MRLLLDTHALVWWALDSPQLSTTGRRAIADAENVVVSIASIWEIAIKVGLGKWPEAAPLLNNIENSLQTAEIEILGASVPHVRAAGLMQSAHRDPFDRMLAAQAQIEGLTLVTADARLRSLGADCLW